MEIKQVAPEMLDDVFSLEQEVWVEDSATRESLRKRIEIFPEGFCAAYSEGRLVGMAMSALLPIEKKVEDYDEAFFPWERIHNPQGEILYLFCSTVHPDFRGMGIWRKMLDFRLNYARNHQRIKKVWVSGRNKENEYGPNTANPLIKMGFTKVKDFLFNGEYTNTLLEFFPPYALK